MATSTLEFAYTSGLTLSVKMFADGSDTIVDMQTATEQTNRKGVYLVNFTDLPDATYRFIAFVGALPVLTGFSEMVQGSTAKDQSITPSDASEAKQDEILSKLTTVTFLATAQPDSTTLELVQGDAYDGTANASLVWTASKDVTGETIEFSIRDETDTLILDTSTSGVAASASGTTITVTLDSTATRLLKACEHRFDVEVQFSSSSKMTVANGLCTVYKDQSR